MIILIAAVAENNTLGKDNQLVWHLPNDFKRFKELTTNHHIIMGRKTFESFPKLLPKRTHVIVTRQDDYKAEGCIITNNIEDAIAKCPKDEDIYVIGGGEIYNLALPLANVIELTRVHENFEGDAFFPTIDKSEWTLVESEANFKDDKHAYDYTYETYVRM